MQLKHALLALIGVGVCLAGSSLDTRVVDALRVRPGSGALDLHHDDLQVGHGREAFVLRRTYAHRQGGLLDFGRNWATCFEVRAVLRADGGFVRTPDGAFLPLDALDERTWVSRRGAVWVDAREPEAPVLYGCGGQAYVLDARGWLQAIRRDGLEVARVLRDGAGQITALEGPWGRVTCARQDGVLTALVLPSGREVRYTRGAHGVLARVDDGLRTQRYAYDDGLRLNAVAGGARTIAYDGLGRVVELGGPQAPTVRYTYAVEAEALTVTERQGEREELHRFGLDGRWSETVAAGSTTRCEFDAKGNLARLERGAQTLRLERDARGRVIERQRGDRHVRTVYAGGSDAPREIVRDGRRERFVRTGEGRLRARVAPDGVERFDADGRLVARSLPGGGSERVRVDAHGERIETLDAAGRVLRAVERDLRGRVVRIEGAHGQVQTLRYAATGELVGTDVQGAGPLELAYDAHGRLTQLADAQGTLASYRYPEAGAVVVRDAAAGETTLTHDLDGRVVGVRRGEQELRRVYNERGQLVLEQRPDGRVRYRYDAQGNAIEVRSPAGTRSATFDADGRPLAITDAQGQTLVARYDAEGRRVALRAPWGEVVYTRDAAGRLVGVTLPDGGEIRIERLADGRRSAVAYPNGVRLELRYDGALLVGQRALQGDAVLLERELAYDAQGRLVELRQGETSTRYAYDAEGRVIEARRGDDVQRFAYDARGNRTDLGRYDAGNHLQAEGLAYDAWGRLTQAQGATLAYDVQGRLQEAALADGRRLRYTYDHRGRRIARELDGATTRFLHDGEQLAGVFEGGELSAGFVHGDRLDDTLAVLHAGQWHFPLLDQVSSVIALTGPEGELVGAASYAPYGQVEGSTLPAWLPLGFAGRPTERELGWVDLRARFYAPELGRFTTPDPLAQRGGPNTYAYVSGNPLSFMDPRGTSEESLSSAEADEAARRQLDALLNDVPEWVAEEARRAGLDPLVALPILADYAEREGWISDQTKSQILGVAITLAQEKLGTNIPTPIDPSDPDDVVFSAVVSLAILAATNGNPYVAAGTFAAELALGAAINVWDDRYGSYDLAPGHVTRRPDGTFTSSFFPGVIFQSAQELQSWFDRAWDENGNGRLDGGGGNAPDLVQEAQRQDAFRITTVLPDGSFMSAHFPGVLFGPDQSDEFLDLLLNRRHLTEGACIPLPEGAEFHGDSLDRLLEFMRLNTATNLAVAEALGLDVFLVEEANGGAASLSYTTAQFPTERYASLQLLVEDATRAAQEEITWSAGDRRVVGFEELPEGVMGPPTPITVPVEGGGSYSTPLIGYRTFRTLPEAFAAMDALYEALEIGQAVPEPAYDAAGNEIPVISPGGRDSYGRLTYAWESPQVDGVYGTRADVVRAYQAQPHILED
ncbi:MAG: RHS repeat-associated core domain-containing protein [Planctomycetota bacterium]